MCNNWKTYTVLAGEHYSRNGFAFPVLGKELNFMLRFPKFIAFPEDQNSRYSKAFGFKEGLWYNKETKKFDDRYSARTGFRANNEKRVYELAAYAHTYDEENGELINFGAEDPDVLYSAYAGEEVECGIKIVGDDYVFNVSGRQDAFPRGKGHWFRYLSRLYIGGGFVLPVDFSVQIKML